MLSFCEPQKYPIANKAGVITVNAALCFQTSPRLLPAHLILRKLWQRIRHLFHIWINKKTCGAHCSTFALWLSPICHHTLIVLLCILEKCLMHIGTVEVTTYVWLLLRSVIYVPVCCCIFLGRLSQQHVFFMKWKEYKLVSGAHLVFSGIMCSARLPNTGVFKYFGL